MLTGPQSMPVFNDSNLTPEEKRDIIAYLNDHRRAGPNPGGFGAGHARPGHRGPVRLGRRPRRPRRLRRLDRLEVGLAPRRPHPHIDEKIGIPMNEQDTTHPGSEVARTRARHRRAPRPGPRRRGRRPARAVRQPRPARRTSHRLADLDDDAAASGPSARSPRCSASRSLGTLRLPRLLLRDQPRRRTIFVPGIGEHERLELRARRHAWRSPCSASASAPSTGPRR